MAKVGRGADQYTVRFSDGLRDRIKAASEASGRSMNDLIVAALEDAFPPPDPDLDEILSLVIADGIQRTATLGGKPVRMERRPDGAIYLTPIPTDD